VEGVPISDLRDESGLQPLSPLLGAPHISSPLGILKSAPARTACGACASLKLDRGEISRFSASYTYAAPMAGLLVMFPATS